MKRLLNYVALSDDMKQVVIQDLITKTSFYPNDFKMLHRYFDMSQSTDKLPQFIFLYDDDQILGYLFLLGESDPSKTFGWLLTHNGDELTEDDAQILIREGKRIIELCNDESVNGLLG